MSDQWNSAGSSPTLCAIDSPRSACVRIYRHTENWLRTYIRYDETMKTLYYYLSLPPGSRRLQREINEKLKSIEEFPVEGLSPPFASMGTSSIPVGPWIKDADILIADISSTGLGGPSPNIAFELGYASGSGKELILIQDIACARPAHSLLGPGKITLLYNANELEPFLEQLRNIVTDTWMRLQVKEEADSGIASDAVYSSRERPDLLSKVADAKQRIWILSTNLESLSPDLTSRIIEALNDRTRPSLALQLCTQDPYSVFVAERAAQIGLPESVYRHKLHASLLDLGNKLKLCDPEQWDVRMYDTFPTQVAYGVDDQVFLSIVSTVRSREPIQFALAGNNARPFFEHFQTLYVRARSIREQYKLYDTEPPPQQVAVDIGLASHELLTFLKKNPDHLYHISPREFEELVAEILTGLGWEVQLTAPTRDGGYDIFALTKDIAGIRTSWIVECKRYSPDRKVGLNVARSLYGVKTDLRVANALLATTSSFTKGVMDFASSRYDFALRDLEGILEWINQYRPHPGGQLYIRDRELFVPR